MHSIRKKKKKSLHPSGKTVEIFFILESCRYEFLNLKKEFFFFSSQILCYLISSWQQDKDQKLTYFGRRQHKMSYLSFFKMLELTAFKVHDFENLHWKPKQCVPSRLLLWHPGSQWKSSSAFSPGSVLASLPLAQFSPKIILAVYVPLWLYITRILHAQKLVNILKFF